MEIPKLSDNIKNLKMVPIDNIIKKSDQEEIQERIEKEKLIHRGITEFYIKLKSELEEIKSIDNQTKLFYLLSNFENSEISEKMKGFVSEFDKVFAIYDVESLNGLLDYAQDRAEFEKKMNDYNKDIKKYNEELSKFKKKLFKKSSAEPKKPEAPKLPKKTNFNFKKLDKSKLEKFLSDFDEWLQDSNNIIKNISNKLIFVKDRYISFTGDRTRTFSLSQLFINNVISDKVLDKNKKDAINIFNKICEKVGCKKLLDEFDEIEDKATKIEEEIKSLNSFIASKEKKTSKLDARMKQDEINENRKYIASKKRLTSIEEELEKLQDSLEEKGKLINEKNPIGNLLDFFEENKISDKISNEINEIKTEQDQIKEIFAELY